MKTIINHSLVLALAALAAAACRGDRAASSAGAPAASSAEPAPEEPAAHRDQYALASAIEDAEALGPDGAARAFAEVRRDWLGKRLRWQVFVVKELCARPDRCHAIPFDRGGSDRDLVHGWMPELHLDQETFGAIQTACEGKSRCSVQIEGTLGDLELSTEYPTALAFHEVALAL